MWRLLLFSWISIEDSNYSFNHIVSSSSYPQLSPLLKSLLFPLGDDNLDSSKDFKEFLHILIRSLFWFNLVQLQDDLMLFLFLLLSKTFSFDSKRNPKALCLYSFWRPLDGIIVPALNQLHIWNNCILIWLLELISLEIWTDLLKIEFVAYMAVVLEIEVFAEFHSRIIESSSHLAQEFHSRKVGLKIQSLLTLIQMNLSVFLFYEIQSVHHLKGYWFVSFR